MSKTALKVYTKGGSGICSPAFDGSGAVYVVSTGNGSILSESEEKTGGGELVEWVNTEGQPTGAAFDPKGRLYVADHAHAAVLNWSDDGSQQIVVREYEGKAFKGPTGLCFDSAGTMYFTDSGPLGESTLQSPCGSVFCISGPADAQILRPLALNCLAHPCGLAVSPEQDMVYVCEMMANRLLRFAQRPAGVFHMSVFYQFSGRMGPSAVACDHSRRGMLYVARYDLRDCSAEGAISVLSAEGELIKEVPVPGAEVSGLTIAPAGDALFVTEASTNTIYRIPLPL